jgi:catechol 2,3-dioxygenase-like lactoylglutathione lyase family enzyme
MVMKRLDHYAIRTRDVAGTAKFYQDILGLVEGPRPNFPFPGIWLYADGVAVVHLVGLDMRDNYGLREYLGDRPLHTHGAGSVDHIAFVGEDILAMRAKLQLAGIKFTERKLPYMPLDALFIEDPNGIIVEMNFPR